MYYTPSLPQEEESEEGTSCVIANERTVAVRLEAGMPAREFVGNTWKWLLLYCHYNPGKRVLSFL